MENKSNLYSRGYLPPWDIPGAWQFVTWRLADSLPEDVCEEYRRARESRDPLVRRSAFKVVDTVLDSGWGSCLLRSPLAARMVAETLLAQQGKSCEITGLVIMPNHVHAILRVANGIELKAVMQQLKGGSAYAVNRLLNRTGRLCQPDYFDRIIRDEEHFDRTLQYIHWNPVKAKLCIAPEHYTYSSANPRYRDLL